MDVKVMADGVVQAVKDLLGRKIDPVERRLDSLEQRLAVAESSMPQYLGVYTAGGPPYRKNSIVTHAGSLWWALKTSSATPGTDPAAWQLCVKRGRDGRDLR